MDIQRPATNKRRNRNIALIAGAAAGFILLTVLAMKFAGRPPGVDGDLVFSGEVTRGEFIHEVTAAGSLYAPEIRSVTNQSEGVVEIIHVLAGHVVKADDVLMVLSSPTLQQELADAEAELEAKLAEERLRVAKAEDEHLNLQSGLADAVGQFEEAQLSANAQRMLEAENATDRLSLTSAINRAEQAERRVEIAQVKVDNYPDRRAAEDSQAAATLDQVRRKLDRLHERVRDLEVRAGVAGVVQEVAVEVGQRLSNGTEVARVLNPELLIARVRVSERDAPLVELGQKVRLEMGRDTTEGVVQRIDPAVSERLVTVDVALTGESTRQLRNELSVTARIVIDRVPDTLVVDRPAGLRDDAEKVELFRLDRDGNQASRVSVEIGRISARSVEIVGGLEAGDRIILADMTEWIEELEIRIR
jgi:multidrug efflux pump subunit AcrA (membrane-fusion protein)